jgi:ATP-binding cassette subfamily C protein CydC
VAIVGPSGAGKSTLINVLLRFWEYESGTITLGGRDLRDYAPDDVRACFGVVSQGAHLFNASVRENLRLARPEASDDEVAAAAREAQIHDFVRSLPQGYDTLIGERGMRLSGGERRRLAIARALLKDAPIVILDEATADLDTLTARDVLAAVRTLTTDRAVLVITHRLVGLEDVDEILVLHGGRVLERGTHADLLRAGGWYARMISLQEQGGVP